MTFTSSCPVCTHPEIEGEQYDGTAVCPECYACLEAGHDCHYDPEAGDEWCCDYWEHDGRFKPPVPHPPVVDYVIQLNAAYAMMEALEYSQGASDDA